MRTRTSLRVHRLVPLLLPLAITSILAACGGDHAAPGSVVPTRTATSPVPPAGSAGAATPAAAAAGGTTVEPTAPSEADAARDKALEPSAAAVVDAFVNLDPILSPDGRLVVYRSTREGSPQVYVADVTKPTESARKLSGGNERVVSPQFTRDGKRVLFLRDEGADENFRIYKADLDGGGLVTLTPGVKLHRDPPLLPRDNPKTMVYAARAATDRSTVVYVQGLDGSDAKVGYTDPEPGGIVDVTADGSHALFVREISANEAVLFDVDLAVSKARRLFPAEGKKSAIHDAGYSSDGKRAFIASDDGAAGQLLYAVDVASGAVTAQYRQDTPPTAFISSVHVAPHGDRVAIGVNAGDHTEVRILDAKTLAVKAKAKAPLGWVEARPFTDDGKQLPLVISTPDRPADIFSLDATTGAITPLRKESRPGLDAMPPITTTTEKVKGEGGTIPVNLYLPKLEAGKKLPTIVLVHGGPSSSSQVRWNYMTRFLTNQGFAIVEPNVRGSTGFGRAYEMADNREKRGNAVRDLEIVHAWAKGMPWCDGERIALMGGSYGGYMTLMGVTRQPKLWRVGVDLFGVADLRTFLKTTTGAIRAYFVEEFGDLDKDAAVLEQFSPLRDVDKVTAPMFVYAGQNDPRVPRSESDLIVSALRARKVPVEYMVAANEGHSLDRRETRIGFLTRVTRFLKDNMK